MKGAEKMKRVVYKEIATAINAIKENSPRKAAWMDYLYYIIDTYFSHGSGFDCGYTVDMDKSSADKIVIESSFHCMDGNGYYCGWNDFTVTVKPSMLFDIDISINFHGIKEKSYGLKDYIVETLHNALYATVADTDSIAKFL